MRTACYRAGLFFLAMFGTAETAAPVLLDYIS